MRLERTALAMKNYLYACQLSQIYRSWNSIILVYVFSGTEETQAKRSKMQSKHNIIGSRKLASIALFYYCVMLLTSTPPGTPYLFCNVTNIKSQLHILQKYFVFSWRHRSPASSHLYVSMEQHQLK